MSQTEKLNYKTITKEECIDLNEKLGRGTYGEIMLMEYRGRKVACKQCLDSTTSKNTLPIIFQRELSLLCRYKHENIIQLVGADIHERILFLELAVMSMHDMILSSQVSKSDGPSKYVYDYKLSNVFSWSAQICRGLNYLHTNLAENRKSLIHRDLKPGNILMFDDCKTVKLCDFGCSREKNEFSNALTREMGTLCYLAPEVIKSGDYGTKCDIYSFGCILWNMIARLPIHHGCNYGNDYQRYTALMSPETTFKPNIKDIPEEFNSLMKNCCNFNPDLRPTSADLFRHFDELSSLNLSGGDKKFVNLARKKQKPMNELFRMSHLLVEKDIRPPFPCEDDNVSKEIYNKSLKNCINIAKLRFKQEFYKNKQKDIQEIIDSPSVKKMSQKLNNISENQIKLEDELMRHRQNAMNSMNIYNNLVTKDQ